jgi:hypothetical protein
MKFSKGPLDSPSGGFCFWFNKAERGESMKLRCIAFLSFVWILCTFACPASAATKKVVLNWAAPASQTGITITGYKVYRGTAAGGEGATAFATVTGGAVTTFTDTNVTAGTSYFYKVTASGTCDSAVWDCSGFAGESLPSNEAASGAIPLPAAPTLGAPSAATAVVQ